MSQVIVKRTVYIANGDKVVTSPFIKKFSLTYADNIKPDRILLNVLFGGKLGWELQYVVFNRVHIGITTTNTISNIEVTNYVQQEGKDYEEDNVISIYFVAPVWAWLTQDYTTVTVFLELISYNPSFNMPAVKIAEPSLFERFTQFLKDVSWPGSLSLIAIAVILLIIAYYFSPLLKSLGKRTAATATALTASK
ncbi:MAG: hypothetical protein QXQ02_06680 [Halobacteria archaeon]